MTKAERQENDSLVRLGCLACLNHFGVYSIPEIHHVRRLGRKRANAPKIPLCPQHHRGPYGIGIHSGRKEWEKRYGSEEEMAQQAQKFLSPSPASIHTPTGKG